ncbi:Asp-tRNA(Asn)/Glu-tRNA(Gln) amidotransferase GatCAB subunit A [Prosthecomicrobium hirschii]|uniref:AtzE family amidohydrolase n=1 Tax=Prosthecodimorpha hirschii TaxID=665126 RepID=UPI0011279C48|nr:AtzE family amidohydrolase [Prosthecomicrobium hirschii]TPQ50162.1 Asp-tRNA(Asn)/Glu-tRNA(Gln) amidotransferase GatCAB subunit A [Prosthecomicrobium hirschii]
MSLPLDPSLGTATEIAAAVRTGQVSADDIVRLCLERIAALNPRLNAFTDVTAARALAKAAAIDAARARGETLPPLAGVPYAVKNLFDIEGLPTRAGSKINRERAPAEADSALGARLEAAGAILLGGLNMGEYAYDFTGQNVHDGNALNPHDPARMAGGSSGGSGTAVAAGMVPLALGSDTNGSIRVPSSLCGLFGLKPTFGRLTRHGTYPFVAEFDHLGPMARATADLALAYDLMQGPEPADGHLADRPIEPTVPELGKGLDGLRIGVLGDHFKRFGHPEAYRGVETVAAALGATEEAILPQATAARAAGFVITAATGSSLHFDRIRSRPQDYDPATRDRFIAGTMIPAPWLIGAQKLRSWYRDRARELFERFDILLAPATPCFAPRSEETTLMLDGVEVPLRPNMGVYTQAISFIGLPVATVPVWLEGAVLPIGVQVIAAPWREDLVLRVSAALEAAGTCRSFVAEVPA